MAEKVTKQYVDLNACQKSLAQSIPNFLICKSKDFRFYDRAFHIFQAVIENKYNNVETISLNGLENDTLNLFLSELNTYSIFYSAKIIYLTHANSILATLVKEKKLLENFSKRLQSVIPTIYCFICIETESKIVFPAEHSIYLQETLLKPYNMLEYFMKEIQDDSWKCEKQAMELLLLKSNYNTKVIRQKLELLKNYCQEKKFIQIDDVQISCSDLEGDFFFKIIDFIAARNFKQTISYVNMQKIEQIPGLCGFCIKIFTLATRTYLFIQSGQQRNTVYNHLSIRFPISKSIENILSNYTIIQIEKIIRELMVLDKNMKENHNKQQWKTFFIIFLTKIIR